jgi:hypothetical protein
MFCWFIEPHRPPAHFFDTKKSVILPLGEGAFFAEMVGKEVNQAYRELRDEQGLLPGDLLQELTSHLVRYGHVTTYAALWPAAPSAATPTGLVSRSWTPF